MTAPAQLDDQILETEARLYGLKLERAHAQGDSIQVIKFKELMYAKVKARHAARAHQAPCFFVEQAERDASILNAAQAGAL